MIQAKLGSGGPYNPKNIQNHQSLQAITCDTTFKTNTSGTFSSKSKNEAAIDEQFKILKALELVAYDRTGLFERLCNCDNLISVLSIKSALQYDRSLRRMTGGLLFFLIPAEQYAAKLINDNFQVLFPGDSQIAIGDLSDAIEKLRTSLERKKLSFASDKSSAI